MLEPLLPAIAKAIGEWFPELGGRSLAVSEAEITRENMPTLPLVMVALVRETSAHVWNGPGSKMTITDDFMIEFMMKAERYKRSDNSESPFWAYFNYEAIRDKLWTKLAGWRGPSGEAIEYVSMDVDADQYSVNISFRCKAHFNWCPDAEDEKGDGVLIKTGDIAMNLCEPKQLYCGPAFDLPTDCDPCKE